MTAARLDDNYRQRGNGPRSWICRRCGADIDSADLHTHLYIHQTEGGTS